MIKEENFTTVMFLIIAILSIIISITLNMLVNEIARTSFIDLIV